MRNDIKKFFYNILYKNQLRFLNINPNILTFIGLVLTIIGSYFIIKESNLLAAIILTIGSVLDFFDGYVAKTFNKNTKFGAFFDSVADRIGEGFIYMSFGILFFQQKNLELFIITFIAMIFAYLVSYIRSRAGALRIDCEIGFFTRPERLFVIIASLVFDAVEIGIIIIGFFSIVTFFQRFFYVQKFLKFEEV